MIVFVQRAVEGDAIRLEEQILSIKDDMVNQTIPNCVINNVTRVVHLQSVDTSKTQRTLDAIR